MIESSLNETRRFEPPAAFAARARVSGRAAYDALVAEAAADPSAFWSELARTELRWHKPFTQGLDWSDAPQARWFADGLLNVADNCLDRHLDTPRRNKAALVWEGEPGDRRTYTYFQLHREVCRFANVLARLGVKAGDRVALYMPLVPELAIAMLACARLGATHSVIFGGFSAEAVRDRINDAGATVVVTADGGFRRGMVMPLKETVDRALEGAPGVADVVVLKRSGNAVTMHGGRDHWWHELALAASDHHEPAWVSAEHPLFILYTSGSTGKPKGVVHASGGYLIHTLMSMRWVFDLQETDTYWCTADAGWVTGHSYLVYGPLAAGATVVMYEGAPNHPAPDRFWEIAAREGVTIFYTAPTAIRAFMKWGEQHPARHDLSALRLLGTVGEPINPEAWMWYHRVIGQGRCPIVDTWWQTETGGIMIAPLPGAIATKPGTATLPLPGIDVAVVDREGREVPHGQGGYLVVRQPWPGMLRTLFRDPERYAKAYWQEIPGFYFAGDGARRDADGYFWIMGRVDDVINVSGHRLGTMEIESALVGHPAVVEAAVVGRPDELKGQAVSAFVTLDPARAKPSEALKAELKAHVAQAIGALARPEEIRFAEALPKTRSGKIMRRLLRDIASGRAVAGDTSTLEDFSVLAALRQEEEA